MRAMCINRTGNAPGFAVIEPPEIVTVIEERKICGCHLYRFAEYEFTASGTEANYHARNFAPLEDIEEEVFETEVAHLSE